jgi:hypothetical protein
VGNYWKLTPQTAAVKQWRRRSLWSESDRVLVPAAVDDVEKPRFGVVILEEYPIAIAYDPAQRRVVTVVALSESRLACDQFAEAIQVVDENVGARCAELSLDILGNPIRVIDEARSVNDAAHKFKS